jgi:hypothetical protein
MRTERIIRPREPAIGHAKVPAKTIIGLMLVELFDTGAPAASRVLVFYE